jgi:Tfp pilus assembly pilus retraction ATPase PilT
MNDLIERLKSKDTESNILDNQLPQVDSSQLNEMQLFAYKLVKYFLENNEQLLMILNGAGGTGKSFTIAAISGL